LQCDGDVAGAAVTIVADIKHKCQLVAQGDWFRRRIERGVDASSYLQVNPLAILASRPVDVVPCVNRKHVIGTVEQLWS